MSKYLITLVLTVCFSPLLMVFGLYLIFGGDGHTVSLFVYSNAKTMLVEQAAIALGVSCLLGTIMTLKELYCIATSTTKTSQQRNQ